MQGDEGENGISIFQSTRFVGLTFTGGLASASTPEELGPRKAGQEDEDDPAMAVQIVPVRYTHASSFIVLMVKSALQ